MTFCVPSLNTCWNAIKSSLLLSIPLASLSVSQTQAGSHCPPGQILRVTKNICVPKDSNLIFLTSKKKSPEMSASRGVRIVRVTNKHTPPRILVPIARSAAAEKPVIVKASTQPTPRPEPASLSPSLNQKLEEAVTDLGTRIETLAQSHDAKLKEADSKLGGAEANLLARIDGLAQSQAKLDSLTQSQEATLKALEAKMPIFSWWPGAVLGAILGAMSGFGSGYMARQIQPRSRLFPSRKSCPTEPPVN